MKTLLVLVIFAIYIACCSSAHFYNNARQILDSSQGKVPQFYTQPGHPRGHAKGHASGHYSINSLQDYSRNNGQKTGFASRADQDRVVGAALRHPLCANKINRLNHGSRREDCTVPAANTVHNLRVEEWRNGNFHHAGIMRDVVIVMGHFRGQQNNPRANIHIQTAFPRM